MVRRLGPRPLAFHLWVTLGTLFSSGAGSTLWRSGWRPSSPGLARRVSDLVAALGRIDGDSWAAAVDLETRRRLDAVLAGVERYRNHPYRRTLAEPETVWQEGASRLLAYGGSGRPVLLVPSLVNRFYILDLAENTSLLRWLAGQGLRPFVLDWGTPGLLERRFTLTDFVAGRLSRALDALLAVAPEPPAVVGYCMGGLLALALCQHRPRDTGPLVLMATPWDFHADPTAAPWTMLTALLPWLPSLEVWGELPTDHLQLMFAQIDPWMVLRKFSRFGRMDPESDQAHAFVALEDWLNDGVPLPAAVTRECLFGWYGRNDTATGTWVIAGLPVEPRRLERPALVLIPRNDRIVPPASAQALAAVLPMAQVMVPPLGHIGMVTSRTAREQVWRPLADWLGSVRSCSGEHTV